MVTARVYVQNQAALDLIRRLERRTSAPSIRIFQRSEVWPWLQLRIRNRFLNEGDGAVGKWAPLAQATGLIRIRKGFRPLHPINRRTGALMRFATSSFKITGGARLVTLTAPGQAGMTKLMKDKVATAQQGGYKRNIAGGNWRGPNRPAPPRPIYALDEIDSRQLSERLMHWITSGGTLGV